MQALFLGATAVGGLIGGWVGDRAAMHYANHGRIFVVQFSVSMGPIFSVLLLKARVWLVSRRGLSALHTAAPITCTRSQHGQASFLKSARSPWACIMAE